MTKYAVQVAGKSLSAARQTGVWDWHDANCACRRCRRARLAQARRAKPRYGQQVRETGEPDVDR